MRVLVALAAALQLAGLLGCHSTAGRSAPAVPERRADPAPVVVPAAAPANPAPPVNAPPAVSTVPKNQPAVPTNQPTPSAAPAVELQAPVSVATVQAEAPRYAPPESLKRFRYAKPPAAEAVGAPGRSVATLAGQTGKTPPLPAAGPGVSEPAAIELPTTTIATVTASGNAPRYVLPDSLKEWRSGRKVPLYVDPDAAPWQATPTEPRLRNAAVSCNYKDEGGVRGKVVLLVNDFKLARYTARIEMPNGGICQFDSKKMKQRAFEQGLALEAKDGECVVRMWEQNHRITIAAYSCHKECSKGSFSYLWPILMDTRIGTCY